MSIALGGNIISEESFTTANTVSLTQTVIPALTDVNFANSVEFMKQYTNYLSIIQQFTDNVSKCIQYNKAMNSNDVVNESVKVFTDINSKVQTLDNQFLVYWLGKYTRCISTIQQLVSSQAGDKSIYSNLSDSIGMMCNTSYMLTDSVVPYNDITSTNYPPPATHPVNLTNKIRPNSKLVATNLSKATSTIFRQNMINVQMVYAASNESHGSNLITDIVAYSRARRYVATVLTQLQTDYFNIFKLVGYFCNINDHTGYNPSDYTLNKAALKGNVWFSMIVEKDVVDIDLLGKRIQHTYKDLQLANALVTS